MTFIFKVKLRVSYHGRFVSTALPTASDRLQPRHVTQFHCNCWKLAGNQPHCRPTRLCSVYSNSQFHTILQRPALFQLSPFNTSCTGGRHNMPRPLQVHLWPWKWCTSHVWRELAMCQFQSSYASLFSTLTSGCRIHRAWQADVRRVS